MPSGRDRKSSPSSARKSEGLKLHLVPPGQKPSKFDATSSEQYGFAVDDKVLRPVAKGGSNNPRISAVAGEQPHPLPVALDDYPVAVMFDLAGQVRPSRHLASTG